jgi:hypothetical protein
MSLQYDLIFGGGRYGAAAYRHLHAGGAAVAVFDPDPRCLVQQEHALPVNEPCSCEGPECFIRGSIQHLLDFLTNHPCGRVFPTAPVHMAACLAILATGCEQARSVPCEVLSLIPPEFICNIDDGTVVVSYNPHDLCADPCAAPDRCPVTGRLRPVPMHELLTRAVGDCGVVLRSMQVKPGLGAIDAGQLKAALADAALRTDMVIGTACRCHGVITALKKKSVPV